MTEWIGRQGRPRGSVMTGERTISTTNREREQVMNNERDDRDDRDNGDHGDNGPGPESESERRDRQAAERAVHAAAAKVQSGKLLISS